jgi:hypothetical protein
MKSKQETSMDPATGEGTETGDVAGPIWRSQSLKPTT